MKNLHQKTRLNKKQRRQYNDVIRGEPTSAFHFWKLEGRWKHKLIVPLQALYFARLYGNKVDVDLEKLEKIVLSSGEGSMIYQWAKSLPVSKFRKFQAAIIQYGTANEILNFSMNVKGADREYLSHAILIKSILDDH